MNTKSNSKSRKGHTPEQKRAEMEALHEKLAEGVETLRASSTWTDYLAFCRSFHRYSFSNLMLILLQSPEATRVAGIDRAAREVVTEAGERHRYDHLILATGARNARPPIPGQEAEGVLELRTLADAARIRARLAGTRHAIVIGGGFIGLEFAAVARKRFGGTLAGTLTLTGGCGGMGGAQPLAVTLNGGACLIVDVDETRLRRRQSKRYLDEVETDLEVALAPCTIGYAEIGADLAARFSPAPDHPYVEWITEYSGEDFQQGAQLGVQGGRGAGLPGRSRGGGGGRGRS